MLHGARGLPKSGAPESASLGKAPALPTNIKLGKKSLAGTNTGLLRKSVNYGRNKFYSTGPLGRSHAYLLNLFSKLHIRKDT